MKILLLGKSGQVGWELERSLASQCEIVALDSRELDITDFDRLRRTIHETRPEIIINAAAYTDVDRAESEPDLALQVNGVAPGVMAEAARSVGAILMHFSTDYVFDGRKGAPYNEIEAPNPLSVYGRTKLAGELAVQAAACVHLILRTSWVYSLRRDCFLVRVLQWARRQETLRVVDDQTSNPTSAHTVAAAVVGLLTRGVDSLEERAGLYHLACRGYVSRFEWAKAILALDSRPAEHVVREILRASGADFPAAARRPLFSALNCDRIEATFQLRLPHWEVDLRAAMAASTGIVSHHQG